MSDSPGVVLVALSLLAACGTSASDDADTGSQDTDESGETDGDDGSGGPSSGGSGDSGTTDGPPGCGNGVLDDSEACDGQDFGGLTCADFGGEVGSLACDACEIDASACVTEPATRFGEPVSWSLPAGGESEEGFYALSGGEWDVGDQSWSVTDLTGDGKPDLVITNQNGDPILSGNGQYWHVYPGEDDGFGEPIAWELPPGGESEEGFYALGGGEWDIGDQSWSTMDLTGDGLPDLVITNADGAPIQSGDNQYWWVHPNTGSGFGETTSWVLPAGGESEEGFYALGGGEWDIGDQSWSTMDLTGDGLPDLVITNADGAPIQSGDNQYWWVHPNTGSGFGETTSWVLPAGGESEEGFYAPGGGEWDIGDQSWSTMDLTGDGLPDLVITNADGAPIRSDGNQYWWVHANTGDGFDEPIAWDLPAGGESEEGFYAPGGSEWDVGDQSWSTADLTGDGMPDLVITNTDGDPIRSDGNQYWWVYPNTGTGFGDPIAWELPAGGESEEGFYALGGGEWDIGDQSWSTLDLNGDRRPDLIITNADGDPIPGPNWIVYPGSP